MKHRRSTSLCWKFPEEQEPSGMSGLEWKWPRNFEGKVRPTLSGCIVSQPASHPWFIIVWEPLNTKAPDPNLVSPYCCYIKTIVFYVRGYIVNPFTHLWKSNSGWHAESPGHRFMEWDECESALTWEDRVVWQGKEFEVGSGRVIYWHKRWWMRHWARTPKQIERAA
jgi:hypothetical protein